MVVLIVLLALIAFGIVVVFRTVRIVPQQTAVIIERLGRYQRTLDPGLHFLVPFIDKVRANIDLREQVVSFPPQPVITSDNLVVNIDTVIYYVVIEAKSAVYEIANFIQGIEQLTVTTLRNVIGSLDLEQTLTSRDQINGQLRGVLDEATGKWGIRVSRVELKAIDPPMSVQESMEKQMKAERDRRALILNAEGVKQSSILTAEGEKQSQILRAEGSAQARILEAQGQARAIQQVFDAIHRGKPTQKLLAYQYLQVLPQIARGDSNKMWIIPSELTDALRGIGGALGGTLPGPADGDDDAWKEGDDAPLPTAFDETVLEDPAQALAEARGQAGLATQEAVSHGEPGPQVLPPLPSTTAGPLFGGGSPAAAGPGPVPQTQPLAPADDSADGGADAPALGEADAAAEPDAVAAQPDTAGEVDAGDGPEAEARPSGS